MAIRCDLIAVVEACYDLAANETDWLQGVADAFEQVLKPEEGLLAYHLDDTGPVPTIGTPVQSGSPSMNMVAKIEAMGALLDAQRQGTLGRIDRLKASVYQKVIRGALKEPADKLLQSEYRRLGPNWMYTLGAPIDDTFALLNQHVDGNGVTAIFGGLNKRRPFRPAERDTFLMLGAHIKAGFRLRRRLDPLATTRSLDVPDGGAVLDEDGNILHAEDGARADDAREALSIQCRWIEQARSQKSGRSEDALGVWKGLIDGRWSLVESFDVDGRRFLVAHRNPEDVRDPRGLSSVESRIVALAAKGHSDKLIAYHLGIADGTVSAHLSHALRKLKIAGRVELVRKLGPSQENAL